MNDPTFPAQAAGSPPAARGAFSQRTPVFRAIPIVLIALLTVACEKTANDIELQIVVGGEPANIDPARASSDYAIALTRQVYQTLYRYKYLARPYELRPELATALPDISQDGMDYTIHLRQGIRFADDPVFKDGIGREMTANDVVYSLKRHHDPATMSKWKWLYQDRIESIRAVDRYTVSFRLDAPSATFLHTLAVAGSSIVPREAVDFYGAGFGRHPVGTGPYRLVHFDGTEARFERNGNHEERFDLAAEGYDPQVHGNLQDLDGRQLPLASRLRVPFVVDAVSRWLLMHQPKSPHVIPLSGDAVHRALEGLGPQNYELVTHPEFGTVRFELRLDGPLGGQSPMGEAEEVRMLRCAMVKAMDWSSRNHIFYNGLGQLYEGVIPPSLSDYDPEMGKDAVTRNLDLARALLSENGWNSDTLPVIRYGYQSGVRQAQGFEHFRANMEELEWPPEKIIAAVYATWGDLSRAAINGEFDVYLRSWTLDYPDAENILGLFYGPNAPGINFSGFRDATYDSGYERLLKMPSGPERTELARDLNEMLVEECVLIGSVSRAMFMAVRDDVPVVPDFGLLNGTWWRFAPASASP